MARILIVDDNRTTTNTLASLIRRWGNEAIPAYDGAEALDILERESIDVLITDLRMPEIDGLELLEKTRLRAPEVVVIVVTAYGSIEVAVEAMKQGAFDFLTKPYEKKELRVKLEKAVAQREMARKMERIHARISTLEDEERERHGKGEMIGESPAMQVIFEQIRKVAPTDATVLILGESGTGKELVARAIHEESRRRSGPFIVTHCAAYAPGVLESELFGHERGAFTGAISRKIGRFEQADGGTLFLDEIGDIPLETQVKLLRFLQERTFERVGGSRTIEVDLRIVAATNRDFQSAIEAGTFREDLFYRLNVFSITLPPLRKRKEDIPALVAAFCERERRRLPHDVPLPDADALEAMTAYDWPGNVRELQNVIERAAILAGGEPIRREHLPLSLFPARAPRPRVSPEGGIDFDREVEAFERALITQAMKACDNVKARAAKYLGIDRNRLRYKLRQYGIEDGS